MLNFGVYTDAVINGVLLGLVYGLAAMGLALIWGVMKVINLSHGAFITLGMFLSYLLFESLHFPPYIAVFLSLGVGIVAGIAVYFGALHRVLNAGELSTLLSTYSVSLIIVGTLMFLFATTPKALNLGINIFTAKIIAAGFSVVFSVLLYLFLYKTNTGMAIRAVSQHPDAAKLMGIDTVKILAFSFGIGVALAMSAGTLISMIFPFSVLSGGLYELKSFVICVIGGLGNPVGALIGGIIVGLLENVLGMFINQGIVPFIEFTILILILLYKPQGIFGGN
ncbi:branched-chain amino acid ABC transporter permease [Desulfurobacterium atlanticum]|uniref:Amino acid/amide ABC transporter membrane protein 1, HAAT family n=1 Tax=Desulfurobacterium atlanticum TaxID=240169 RepID=A0A238Y166_9BACT|nr:branched-chain amino acid ABC transporter permease [Desulfurobacterium atlanticum]SNR64965.1 amino acid/amide ABC transporter membrane protein 1, HAAT family [Desulfurobacterium atlanticum]